MKRRLTSAAHCAIKMRSTQPDRKEAVKTAITVDAKAVMWAVKDVSFQEFVKCCKVAAGKTSDGACTCETDEEKRLMTQSGTAKSDDTEMILYEACAKSSSFFLKQMEDGSLNLKPTRLLLSSSLPNFDKKNSV